MRSIWKGALSFGLIHIPVRLYSASRSRELQFKLLHKQDLSEIRYARICKADGKEIPWTDIVKGYEYREGDYVVLTEEDFARANLKKTKTIEILEFAKEDEIEPIYYEKPYYLEPEQGAAKAYHLLREALKQSKKVAVGNFILKQHEHVGVIKPYKDILVLNQLRYNAELTHPKDLHIPKETSLPKNEVAIALELIDQLTKPFKPEDFKDTYTKEVKKIIEQKAKGKKVKIKKGAEEKPPKIHDIMSLLRTSLEQHKKKPKRRRAA